MRFTINNIIHSIADQLAETFPKPGGGCLYKIHQSPTFNSGPEGFYIFPVLPSMRDEPSERLVREIMFDVVYVQQRNLTDQNASVYAILEKLDESFDMLTFRDGAESCRLHTYDRNASIEDQELHYKFRLMQRVFVDVADKHYLQELEDVDVNIEKR